MYKSTQIILALFLFAGIFGVSCSGSDKDTSAGALGTGLDIGMLAPDFQLSYLDGTDTSLFEHKGKPVLLNFWATWCGPCVREMPILQEIYETRGDDGLVILAVNSGENRVTVAQFLQANGYTLPVLLDSRQAVTARYNIRGIPATYFIDSNGIIRHVQVGAFSSESQLEGLLKKIMP
jgi:thiol-disulfide isomerase/thioredoxin